MSYLDPRERAQEYANKARDLMDSHAIAPTPDNFRLWYDYATGRNPTLRQTIDALVAAGQAFSDRLCAELYEQFFIAKNDGDHVLDISTRVHETVGQIMGLVGEAGKDSAKFGAKLAGFHGQVAAAANDGALQSLVAQIVRETGEMAERNKQLEGRLSKSADEITQLRGNLEEIRREALLDPLTGVYNRKAFDQNLKKLTQEARKDGSALSLLMLDIDHFKKFNDTWGHQVGDQVLKLLARTLRDNVKGQDVVARYGGEEFAVILPHTELDAAVTLADSIREALMAKQLVKKGTGQDMGRMTASFGAARFTRTEALGELVGRADEALYAAKRSGRNRVVAAGQVVPLMAASA